MNRSKVVCFERINGELHLLLEGFESHVCATKGKIFGDAAKIKRIMKKEALKPLFLMRG